MKIVITEWVRSRIAPFEPTEPIQVASGAALVLDDEVARAVELRVNERYGADGNHPRDKPQTLVDEWCARGGVAFAMEACIGVTTHPRRETTSHPNYRQPYAIRHDGQPWWRLREQMWAAPAEERAKAVGIAKAAWDPKLPNELPFALAFMLCEPAWVEALTPAALEDGYGKLCVLAATRDAARGRSLLKALIEGDQRFQLVEEAWPFVPTLLTVLAEADADLVVRAAQLAWNKPTRKPWIEIVKCLPKGGAAAKFLAEHDAASSKKSVTKPTKKPTKKPAKKPVKKPVKKLVKKPAKTAKKPSQKR